MPETSDRDDQIRAEYARGTSLRGVAFVFDLSYERVRKIVGAGVRSTRARALDGQLRSLRTPLNVTED